MSQSLREQIAALIGTWRKEARGQGYGAHYGGVESGMYRCADELSTLLASLDPLQGETGDTQSCENCDGVWDIAKMRLTADGVWLCARCMESLIAATGELPDVEAVSAKVHEAWMASKAAQGVTSRKSEDGEELIAPYGHLSEKAKDLDRETVRAVYVAIRAAAPTPERQEPV